MSDIESRVREMFRAYSGNAHTGEGSLLFRDIVNLLQGERRRAIEEAAKIAEMRSVSLRAALPDQEGDIAARIWAVVHNLERCAEAIRALVSPPSPRAEPHD